MSADIVNLGAKRADKFNDNRLVSPGDCLADAKSELESGKRIANKVLILTLNDVDGGYDVGHYASDLSCAEMIALMEVAKARFLSYMGVIPEQ